MKGNKFGLLGTALAGLVALVNSANANEVSTLVDANDVNIQNSSVELVHHSRPELFGMSFNYGQSLAVDIFYGLDSNRKKQIAETAENMDTQTATVSGRGLSAPQDCELGTDIRVAVFGGSMFPEENMVDKEMTRDIYDFKIDPCGVLIESYDTKALDQSGMTIPLEVQNGLSYKVVDSFDSNTSWVRSDANRDGIVNLDDFDTLSKFYGKDCSTIVGAQDSYDCFSIDTNDDGIIDMADMINLSYDWLQSD